MAYQAILFPNPGLIHGLKKEIIQATTIVTNGNTEYRISKMANPRRRWTWQARAISNADKTAIVSFASTVDMALDSFRFYDPFDKIEYHVRFDQASLSFTAEAMDTSDNITYVTFDDINLIQVFE